MRIPDEMSSMIARGDVDKVLAMEWMVAPGKREDFLRQVVGQVADAARWRALKEASIKAGEVIRAGGTARQVFDALQDMRAV